MLINVKSADFGPPAVGDGATNDGPAIQLKLNGMADGDSLYFPAGRYLVLDTLVSSKSVGLRGDPAIPWTAFGGTFSNIEWNSTDPEKFAGSLIYGAFDVANKAVLKLQGPADYSRAVGIANIGFRGVKAPGTETDNSDTTTGVVLGSNAVGGRACRAVFSGVSFYHLGIGLDLQQCLDSTFTAIATRGCKTGIRIQRNAVGESNANVWVGMESKGCDKAVELGAHNNKFLGGTVQGYQSHGFSIDSGNGNAIEDVYFEGGSTGTSRAIQIAAEGVNGR